MKRMFFIICIAVVCNACTKSASKDNGCFAGIRLTPTDSVPHAGDDVTIYANIPKLLYHWSGPGNFSTNGWTDENYITIPAIEIKQSGWYYCTAYVPDCDSHTDSVYIRVQYQQGTPPCSVANNTINSSVVNLEIDKATVRKYYGLSNEAITVSAWEGIGYPEYYFVFNSFNGNTEPKDGIYYTTNIPVFEPEQDADVINLNIIYDIFYFTSNERQKVYVSHVNGKLRISFCDIKCDDSSGVNGTVSGQLTEQ